MALARRSACRIGAINFGASGDNIVVSASATGPINIYGWRYTVSGATNITFKDVTQSGGVPLASGPFMFTGAGASDEATLSDEPWFQCQPGDSFVMNSSNAVQVGGMVYYTTG